MCLLAFCFVSIISIFEFGFFYLFIHKLRIFFTFCFSWDVGVPIMDIEAADISFNLVSSDTQLMNKGVIWRGGGREKDSSSIQIFIGALTKPGAMVFDVYASTCDCNIFLSFISILSLVLILQSLLMNVVLCGFQGLLFKLVSVVDATL